MNIIMPVGSFSGNLIPRPVKTLGTNRTLILKNQLADVGEWS